jgi:tetrahydromethanopterin S-methyltransferase subunit G
MKAQELKLNLSRLYKEIDSRLDHLEKKLQATVDREKLAA